MCVLFGPALYLDANAQLEIVTGDLKRSSGRVDDLVAAGAAVPQIPVKAHHKLKTGIGRLVYVFLRVGRDIVAERCVAGGVVHDMPTLVKLDRFAVRIGKKHDVKWHSESVDNSLSKAELVDSTRHSIRTEIINLVLGKYGLRPHFLLCRYLRAKKSSREAEDGPETHDAIFPITLTEEGRPVYAVR